MFEDGSGLSGGTVTARTGVVPTPALIELKAALAGFDEQAAPATRIDRIRALEELKNAVAAAQALETAAFVAGQRAAADNREAPPGNNAPGTSAPGNNSQGANANGSAARARARDAAERALAAQVGLAKRSSPFHARRYCGWATILTCELPATFAQFRAGRVTEWRAMIVARETAWLSRADREAVDAALAPHLEQWGDARVEAAAKTLAYELDPAGYMARIRGALSDRRVSIRPAPDVMARLSALLPAAQGIAAHTALAREADRLRASGDARSRAQIMADTLVQRLTGQTTADDVAVEIELIMTDETLFGASGSGSDGANQPGHLIGYGPIPADLARDLALGANTAPDTDLAAASTDPAGTDPTGTEPTGTDPTISEPAGRGPVPASAPRWIRRLFTGPNGRDLAAMESQRRLFTTAQCRFIRLRDQGICRTPWCDAPIRHTDHVRRYADGGRTSVCNGQGLCEACNHIKETAGWLTEALGLGLAPDIRTTTPTGHQYDSPAPHPPTPVRGQKLPTIQIDLVYLHRHRAA